MFETLFAILIFLALAFIGIKLGWGDDPNTPPFK